jgi:hypothetical protein
MKHGRKVAVVAGLGLVSLVAFGAVASPPPLPSSFYGTIAASGFQVTGVASALVVAAQVERGAYALLCKPSNMIDSVASCQSNGSVQSSKSFSHL